MRVRASRPQSRRRVPAPAIVALVAVAALAAGCGGSDEPRGTDVAGSASTGPVTLKNCGFDVTVTAVPARVVTMNQAATEIMLALGLGDRLIGTAYLDDTILPEYADAYRAVPVLAKEYPSKEKLLEVGPDFVYGSFASAFGEEGAGDRAALRTLGIGSYLSPAGCPADARPATLTVDHVFDEIREVATVFGVPDRATALVDAQRARITAAAAKPRAGVSVFWWDDGTDAPSAGACCGAPGMIMSAVGARNIFADVTGSWGDTSWEAVVERNPDVIVLIDAEWSPAAGKQTYLEASPTLRDLPAVRDKRFVTIPFSATSAGIRNVTAIEGLANGLAAVAPRTGG
ncbi:ABC transporter substrate-binding protein [Micromonospora sp. NBC_01699]|uniref:ABC transporter substrate-binding protein n=1 Tax=Micromonospora sp. NBC_01699 TaxID=2975984 RepID=UPI002E306669|nr:ABC transporter substrate-binding protein [Micromonospora sp. NBC_01699]